MKISILGTGIVGQTIAEKLVSQCHEVFLGTRVAEKTKISTEVNQMTGRSFLDWYSNNQSINIVNFEALPNDSELFINATSGIASIEALNSVGKGKLKGKTILDIANPLDFSKGMPATLTVCNTDSLGEQLQREFEDSNIVKSLNTMNCFLMVNPKIIEGNHNVFVSGNNSNAKEEIKELLKSFGWNNESIIDLGDITTARGTEMLLPIWLRLWGALGTPEFNFGIVKK